MSYRPLLGEQVLRQMRGLPAEGFDLLVQVLARICEDPYDRLFSRAIRADVYGSSRRRRASTTACTVNIVPSSA